MRGRLLERNDMKEIQLPRFEMRAVGAPSDRQWFCVACVGLLGNFNVFAFLEPEEANADAARLERQADVDTLFRFVVTANVEKDAVDVQCYAADVLKANPELIARMSSTVRTDENGALNWKVPKADNEGRTVQAYSDAITRSVKPATLNDADRATLARLNTEGARVLADESIARRASDDFDYWRFHAEACEMSRGTRGGFAAHIGDAYCKADKRNARRLVAAFPELFGQK
jgi:hypothetical protein